MATRILVWTPALALVWNVACGSSDGDVTWGALDRSAGSNRRPVIEHLRIEPADPAISEPVHARVSASDGENESDPIDTARERVVHANPKIVSVPGSISREAIFRYTVEFERPLGTEDVRYRLRTGPNGMWVNPVSGEITWRPRPSQRGSHTVEVAVEDSRGAVTVQAFRLEVGAGAELSSPPANQAAD